MVVCRWTGGHVWGVGLLTHSNTNTCLSASHGLQERRGALQGGWGFTCHCRECEEEARVTEHGTAVDKMSVLLRSKMSALIEKIMR